MHTVLIVEDDPLARRRLIERVEGNSQVRVVGAVGSVAGARELLNAQAVDILLVDLELEDGNGTTLIRELHTANATTLIMVVSVFGDEQSVIGAIEAGARGYLLKDDSTDRIAESIEQLLDGGSPISPGIARHLIKRFQPEPEAPVEQRILSERELEVLNLAARGFTYAETADLLGVSVNTISSYTRRMYTKLAVNSRSQAVFEAQRMGLMQEPKDPQ